ncbi:hypothetical protein SAMN04487983_10453 [Streptomyces sp. yr375]|uniref:hypothetical protein n=1 Tax=Streptomyces sp. yr375 TaxID=1761906 RepID=UPI0008BB3DC9|nr:hypothetical protein [Streptomyces sp. yr375]SES35815.1 hypothetical protein SAMN04487983_10453 [Streptomyces sp. yr375]
MTLHTATAWALLASGLIFLLALFLGVWKWFAMTGSPDGRAHPYVDVAHRSALLYAFATQLIAVLVQFSGWSATVNGTAATVIILLFVGTIGNYIRLAVQGGTDNQMHNPPRGHLFVLLTLILGEIGGFAVLLAGFAKAQSSVLF